MSEQAPRILLLQVSGSFAASQRHVHCLQERGAANVRQGQVAVSRLQVYEQQDHRVSLLHIQHNITKRHDNMASDINSSEHEGR